jgi:hypothetical protein
MIQEPAPGAACSYATMWAPGAHQARLARPVQSAAADHLLQTLRSRTQIPDGPASKAHARALVAAAVSPSGQVGVDVEFFAPARPIQAIAQWLMAATARDDLAAYRVFTFREAYFKAFGDWPARGLLLEVADADANLYVLDGDMQVLHERISEDFLLTLVWRGAERAQRVSL